VIAISLACFVLFFGVMTIRLSVGDDPALGGATGSSSTGTGEATTREVGGERSATEGGFEGSEGPSIEERSLFGEEQVEPEAVHSGQS
jgi:hypothetical protein